MGYFYIYLALLLTCYYYCREVLSAPVRRIDEILALPHSADDFKHQQLPPSDDDSWLYGGEDEINAALKDREKEMELYNSEQKKKHKSKEQQEGVSASKEDYDEYDLGGIAKSMEAFVEKISSYEGAEVPEDRFYPPLLLYIHISKFSFTFMMEICVLSVL